MGLAGRLIGATVIVGAAAAVAVGVVAAPRIFRASRPFLREALRRGISAYDRVRSASADLIEDIEDLVAEVRAEVLHDSKAANDEDPATPEQRQA